MTLNNIMQTFLHELPARCFDAALFEGGRLLLA